jgi:DNA-binding NarL/FixJ family response regulator
MKMKKIRILLAHDHTLLRETLRLFLETQSDIQVVGETNDGSKVPDLVPKLKPTILLINIRMPGLDGLQATRLVKTNHPQVGTIILTTYPQETYIIDALKAGAMAYLSKDTTSEQLLHVIRSVHQGQAIVDPNMTASIANELHRLDEEHNKNTPARLTNQDLEMLTLAADGAITSDIAQKQKMSERGVKNRFTTILKKLNATNRTQAVMKAVRAGLIK